MSEHLHNGEELPAVRLNMADGSQFESTPLNTFMFNFIGKAALRGVMVEADKFDHIFIQTGEETETAIIGSYLFREDPVTGELNEVYGKLGEYMVENNYTLHLNLRHVPDCDKDAYLRAEEQAIARALTDLDEIPDWMNGDESGE